MQGETPTLRRATVGPILAEEFPPASELLFIGITVAEHLALDNARFIAVFHDFWHSLWVYRKPQLLYYFQLVFLQAKKEMKP